MKNNLIDFSKSSHVCCRCSTVKKTAQPSENHNDPTDRHFKTKCKCCNQSWQKGPNAMPSIPFYVVVATNTANWFFADWVVAVYQSELDAKAHCEAAQAVADQLFEDFRDRRLEGVDLRCLKNPYDPHFRFDPEGVDYIIERHALYKAG